MPLVDPGQQAPPFSLEDQDGRTHSLSAYAGRPVVLYFYPKDDTPGCTTETCEFRDTLPKFESSKTAVLGASILGRSSKAKFAAKYQVPFPLLADEDHAVAESYGVWQEKSQVRANLHGDRPHDVSHRRRWEGRTTLGQGQG